MVVQQLIDGEVEVIHAHSDLAPGSLAAVRAKFADSKRKAALQEIVDELTNGGLYLGKVAEGEIEITGIARIISNRFWTEVEYSVLFPPKADGELAAGTYRVIRWNAGVENGAAVLCLTVDGLVALQREFRHAQRRWCIQIPRGLRLPGECLHDCALREAREERGVKTTCASQVIELGEIDPDNGVLMSRPRIVAVTKVISTTSNRDVSESVIGPLACPVTDVWRMIRDGVITDAFTRSAMLSAALHGLIEFAA